MPNLGYRRVRASREGVEGFSVASVAVNMGQHRAQVCFYAKCDIAEGEELLPFGRFLDFRASKDLLRQELVAFSGHSRCHRGTADATASSRPR